MTVGLSRLILATLALALTTPVLAQSLTPQQNTAIDKAVRDTLSANGTPSTEVAMALDGKLVLSRAWGKAADSVPVVRPDLPYQIASNSKQFLAALILML